METASDETGCDMDKPVGFWVRQTRATGETLAVKVRYDQAQGQVHGATISGNSEKVNESEA
jgi:hypothetical protein